MDTQHDLTGDGEPRAEIRFLPRWGFVLGPRDTLLVLRALGGRLGVSGDLDRDERELAEACALGDRLTLLREQQAKQSYIALQRAADAVQSKGVTL
jgi:hypothetical protein